MDQQRVRTTYQYQLTPTAEHARVLEHVVWRCRELYNAGLHERNLAWEQRHIAISCAMQSAQLPGSKEARPEYRDRNAQVVPVVPVMPVMQDVLHRLDTACQACFRRVQAYRRAPWLSTGAGHGSLP